MFKTLTFAGQGNDLELATRATICLSEWRWLQVPTSSMAVTKLYSKWSVSSVLGGGPEDVRNWIWVNELISLFFNCTLTGTIQGNNRYIQLDNILALLDCMAGLFIIRIQVVPDKKEKGIRQDNKKWQEQ